MPKRTNPNDYELREEYDFSKMTVQPKGRYAPHRRTGKNVALLAPDVMKAFPTDASVNEALRLVIQAARIPSKRKAVVKKKPSATRRTTQPVA